MAVSYLRVRHSNGVEDCVPVEGAQAREKAGLLTILDPTPIRYRKFSDPVEGHVSHSKFSDPDGSERPKRSPKTQKAADSAAVDSAAVAAPMAEEASE